MKQLTAKQQRFLALLIEGKSPSEAYRGAFDCDSMSARAIATEAWRLRSRPDIAHMLREARQEVADRAMWSRQQAVERLAPTHVTVPTGSRIRLEYRQGTEAPVLRVRLQECFGLMDSPRVDDGRRPVLMELLSPGYKPVQLTSDLRSFWSGTYFEVRKELRRRYPRHAWPDDPLAADPVRGVKRK
jgi:HrpA-like RNA helicase